MKKIFLVIFIVLFVLDNNANAYNPEGFNKFVNYIQAEARRKGVKETTLHDAFRNVKFDFRVIAQDMKQPERNKNADFQKYKNKIITKKRIATAKQHLDENLTLLSKIEQKFGVEKEILVALWAVESNFGTVMGRHDTITALTSLAYEGRRREFFQNELINALVILDQKHIDKNNFKGSWAGAFGQVQFMPSTFLNYAYDFNNDGRKNLWYDDGDALASAANYLKNIGWEANMGWGKRVRLPQGFNSKYIGKTISLPIYKWKALGIKFYDGGFLPNSSANASIIDPDGIYGTRREVYIVFDNYKRIMEWNNSTYFATSIGLISDGLK